MSDYNFTSVTCEKNDSTLTLAHRKTGSIRDDPYWTSRKSSLQLIELSSINKVSLV